MRKFSILLMIVVLFCFSFMSFLSADIQLEQSEIVLVNDSIQIDSLNMTDINKLKIEKQNECIDFNLAGMERYNMNGELTIEVSNSRVANCNNIARMDENRFRYENKNLNLKFPS